MKTKKIILQLLILMVYCGNVNANWILFYDKFLKVKNGRELFDEIDGVSVKDRRDAYMKLAKPLEHDLKSYMWGRTGFVDSVVKYNFSDDYMKAVVNPNIPSEGKSELQMAGRGIYVSKDPVSSQKYGTGPKYNKDLFDPAGLVEIALKKGTPFLDLNNINTMMELKKLGKKFGMKSLKQVIFDIVSIDPPIVLHYHFRQWYVIKTNQNVTAKFLDGRDHHLDWLLKNYRKMKYPRGRRIFVDQIKRKLDTVLSKNNPDYNTTEKIYEIIKKTFNLNVDDMTIFLRDNRRMSDIRLHKFNQKKGGGRYYAIVKYPGIFVNGKLKNVGFDENSNLDLICNYLGFSKAYQGLETYRENIGQMATFKAISEKPQLSEFPARSIIKTIACWL